MFGLSHRLFLDFQARTCLRRHLDVDKTLSSKQRAQAEALLKEESDGLILYDKFLHLRFVVESGAEGGRGHRHDKWRGLRRAACSGKSRAIPPQRLHRPAYSGKSEGVTRGLASELSLSEHGRSAPSDSSDSDTHQTVTGSRPRSQGGRRRSSIPRMQSDGDYKPLKQTASHYRQSAARARSERRCQSFFMFGLRILFASRTATPVRSLRDPAQNFLVGHFDVCWQERGQTHREGEGVHTCCACAR